jgi:hypothetical protein
MAVMNDLPVLTMTMPAGLPVKPGGWIDNGWLSNYHDGEAMVRYMSVTSRRVEPAYVASKNPMALVPHFGEMIPFHVKVAREPPATVERLGKPRSMGGLIDPRPDWEQVCVAAMWAACVQKFAPGTAENASLMASEGLLVEWTNWGDRRWGVSPDKKGKPACTGRNALGLMLMVLREDLAGGRVEHPEEKDWARFQGALMPRMSAIGRMRPTAQPSRQMSLF